MQGCQQDRSRMKLLPGHWSPKELALCAPLPCPGIPPLSVPVLPEVSLSPRAPGPVCSSCFYQGESGGSLVCPLQDQHWVQAAVVSFSRVCAEPSHPGCVCQGLRLPALDPCHGLLLRHLRGGRPLAGAWPALLPSSPPSCPFLCSPSLLCLTVPPVPACPALHLTPT